MVKKGPGAGSPRFLCFLALVAVFVTVLVPPLAAEASGGLVRAGFFNKEMAGTATPANGNILIDHAARRIYQAVVVSETILYEYDLDSLTLLRTLNIPVPLWPAYPIAGPTDWVWTLDSGGRRLFMFDNAPDPDLIVNNYRLLEVNLETMQLTSSVELWPGAERFPLAINYHAPTGRLYIFTQLSNVEVFFRSVFFLEERSPGGALNWDYPLRNCYSARDQQYPPTVVRSVLDEAKLYLNCYNAGAAQSQVVRLTLGPSGPIPDGEEVFPALPAALSTLFDPGSDRMFFLTTNSGAGRGAWVFDGLRSSFLGVIATGDTRLSTFDYSMGLDPLTGRLYMHSPVGIIVADGRRTPLPAGLLFREFANFGAGVIQVDPTTQRVFVPDVTLRNATGHPLRYMILRDEIPPPAAESPTNPDALTADLEERPGVTAVNFSGAAAAFAARSLTTGGLQKAAWNATFGLQFSPEQLEQAWSVIRNVPLNEGNRDLYLARIKSVSLANNSADAIASLGSTDPGTLRDIEDQGHSWPLPKAECHASGDGSGGGSAAGTAVTCDAGLSFVSASSGAGDDSEGSGISFGSVFSFASSQIEEGRGLVSRSTAIVTGVSILDRVWIGEIATRAETWATGRPGKAGADFVRTISRVTVDINDDGTPDYQCVVCVPAEVRTIAARALAGQANLDLPNPDPAFYPDGSPGGYQAVVEREKSRSFAESALNDDDGAEVVGLQVVLYGDARAGRTRQIIQLAGVQAESHYGIYAIPKEESEPPAPPPLISSPVFQTEVQRSVVLGEVIVRPPSPPITRLESILRKVAEGIGIFISRPADAALSMMLWLFLLSPLVILHRRNGLAGSK